MIWSMLHRISSMVETVLQISMYDCQWGEKNGNSYSMPWLKDESLHLNLYCLISKSLWSADNSFGKTILFHLNLFWKSYSITAIQNIQKTMENMKKTKHNVTFQKGVEVKNLFPTSFQQKVIDLYTICTSYAITHTNSSSCLISNVSP